MIVYNYHAHSKVFLSGCKDRLIAATTSPQWLLKLSGIGGGANLSSVNVCGSLLLGDATLFW